MSIIRVSHPTKKINTRVRVPGSKSESNRALILNALSVNKIPVQNLSAAQDTQTLLQILSSSDVNVNVEDAGTAMRFLIAYYAATNQHAVITGSDRMKERPIAPLVNALSEIGFDVRFKGKEGFPPVEIVPLKSFDHLDNEVSIEGNVSSQFISALLMIAPFLPKGLKMNFTTELTSSPYVDMTLNTLESMGVKYAWNEDSILILPQSFNAGHTFAINADWTSASYWYSIAFLAEEAEIFLEGLKDDWNQGDREMADWMKRFGVTTEFTSEGALVKKTEVSYPHLMKMNFTENPDLAQTFAAMYAAKNVYCNFSGIDSLRIKETDRIVALQTELAKMNISFEHATRFDFYQMKGEFQFPSSVINTYNDHRMAMSFAPLALLGEIQIENPDVVAKSYPEFWNDLQKAGFEIK